MSTYIKVIIVGTLGQTPVLMGTKNGRPFCRLSLATDGIPSKDGSERRTSWHMVHVFGKNAENAALYLTKGRQVMVEGRMDTTATVPEDPQGKSIWRTWITAERLIFLGSAPAHAAEGIEGIETAEIPAFDSPEQAVN